MQMRQRRRAETRSSLTHLLTTAATRMRSNHHHKPAAMTVRQNFIIVLLTTLLTLCTYCEVRNNFATFDRLWHAWLMLRIRYLGVPRRAHGDLPMRVVVPWPATQVRRRAKFHETHQRPRKCGENTAPNRTARRGLNQSAIKRVRQDRCAPNRSLR